MRIRCFIAYVAAGFMVLSCSNSDSEDTYIRFLVEDKSYETAHATFSVVDLNRRDWRFVEIAKDVAQHDASDAPTATLQWRMELIDLVAFVGQPIAIRNLNDGQMADPLISFELPADVTIANMTDTDASVTITSIAGGIVEGSFRGNKLNYFADGQQKTVDVSGTFRARLLD